MRFAWMILFLGVLMATGCRRTPAAPPSGENRPICVLASVYPMADIVRQVGGPWVNIDWVVEAPQDVRDVQTSDALTHKLAWAQLIVTSGFDDPWADQNLASTARSQSLIQPEHMPQGLQDVRLTPWSDGVALWLDPVVAQELAQKISVALGSRDLVHAAQFTANAAAFNAAVQRLMEGQSSRFAAAKQKKFLVIRPAWSAFAQRLGLQEIAPLDAQAIGLSDAQARLIRQKAAEEHTNLLVVDRALAPEISQDLARRTGLKLLPLDLLGSSASQGIHTYIELLRYNLDALANATGAGLE